jgi:hypothetical protein
MSQFEFPEIIQGLLDHGIDVTLRKDAEGTIAFVVEGFGKNGHMKLYPSPDAASSWEQMHGIDRYGDWEEFGDLADVVRCYIRCAEEMSERCGGTAKDALNGFCGPWADLAVELGILKAKEVTTVTYQRL